MFCVKAHKVQLLLSSHYSRGKYAFRERNLANSGLLRSTVALLGYAYSIVLLTHAFSLGKSHRTVHTIACVQRSACWRICEGSPDRTGAIRPVVISEGSICKGRTIYRRMCKNSPTSSGFVPTGLDLLSTLLLYGALRPLCQSGHARCCFATMRCCDNFLCLLLRTWRAGWDVLPSGG